MSLACLDAADAHEADRRIEALPQLIDIGEGDWLRVPAAAARTGQHHVIANINEAARRPEAVHTLYAHASHTARAHPMPPKPPLGAMKADLVAVSSTMQLPIVFMVTTYLYNDALCSRDLPTILLRFSVH